ncbi:MAG: branched-chain amino acid ABC transporter permease [Clostridiales bacterium]|nr:branched-chain amino acid ABC transporter permease [Clostridiales bacterium]
MNKIKHLNKFTLTNIKSYGLIIIAFAILFPLQSAGMISNSISGQLVPICTYIVMAISLTLTVGFLGELSLGHAGFMSVGAFTGVIAAACFKNLIPQPGLLLLTSIIIGGIFAGIAGLVIGIPVLRLRGDYLAIVTLAFGEIIKNIINCLYVGVDVHGLHVNMLSADALAMENGQLILNGPQGAVGITKLATLGAGVLLILFSLFIVLNLVNSKAGRAVTAIRDNRIAAESVGIGITRYKLTAFIISAVLAGMAGAMYAMNFSTIAAKKFDFNTSILILVFVVLGGMNNIPGTIVATALLYMLPELLRGVADYRMLIYAVILIIVMLVTNSEKAKQLHELAVYKIKNRKTKERGEK